MTVSLLEPTEPPAVAPGPAVVASDDLPVVLEAKADILSDLARRLDLQATWLDRMASRIRKRQALRRRADQMQRDPFADLEGPKRISVVRGRDGGRTPDTGGSPETDPVRGVGPGAATPPAPGAITPQPPPQPPGGAPPGTGPTIRGLLGPAALGDVGRTEERGRSLISEPVSLERAAAALRARAKALEADARALRARSSEREGRRP
jgi:hypothetical protein